MAAPYHSKNMRAWLAYVELTRGFADSISVDSTINDLPATTLGDTVERMVPDPLAAGMVKISGYYEQTATLAFEAILRAALIARTVLTVCPNGAALGDYAQLVRGFVNNKSIPASVRNLIKLDAQMRAEGGVQEGVVVQPERVETIWHATTVLAAGVYVRPVTDNGHYYKVTTPGTTGSSPPTFPTSAGGTVTNGSVVFTEQGTTAHDRGAATTGDWFANFHCVLFSGSSAVLHDAIMHSSNNSAYSELAGLDYGSRTVAQISGNGTVNRYVRAFISETAGTLTSVTHVAALAATNNNP